MKVGLRLLKLSNPYAERSARIACRYVGRANGR
jgi:hypothetical protein